MTQKSAEASWEKNRNLELCSYGNISSLYKKDINSSMTEISVLETNEL
jgi:hypothetical protein